MMSSAEKLPGKELDYLLVKFSRCGTEGERFIGFGFANKFTTFSEEQNFNLELV